MKQEIMKLRCPYCNTLLVEGGEYDLYCNKCENSFVSDWVIEINIQSKLIKVLDKLLEMLELV